MAFLRQVLDLPVLRNLGWSSKTSETAVEAEYGLMEKVSGRPQAELWEDMQADEQLGIVEQIVQIQYKLASFRFPSYGSIFYADDVDSLSGSEICQDKGARIFVVGPTPDRAYFDIRRNEMQSDLGPWRTAEGYFLAIVERESACVKESGRSGRNQGIHDAPETNFNSFGRTKICTSV